jgi:hemolysin III
VISLGRGYSLGWVEAQRFVAEEVIPRLRGLLHAHATWVAAVAAIVLIAIAPTAAARWAALIYGAAMIALFGFSALYHRWHGDPRWKPWLRRLDHSTIFVFIAASYTPIALLVLDGTVGTIVLISVWVGAAAGVALSLAWTTAPRVFVACCYLALGWVAVVAIPELWRQAGPAPFVLFAAGGALYSLGAAVYAAQRPDWWPRTFGFHEVFHTLVIAAALVHFIAIAGWVVPGAGN